jgi:hypothetical protein
MGCLTSEHVLPGRTGDCLPKNRRLWGERFGFSYLCRIRRLRLIGEVFGQALNGPRECSLGYPAETPMKSKRPQSDVLQWEKY